MREVVITTLVFIALSLLIYILMAAQTLFLPLVLAFVISYVIITFSQAIEKLSVFNFKLPRKLVYPATMITLLLITTFFFFVVSQNVAHLVNQAPAYQAKLQEMIESLFQYFKIKTRPDFSQFFRDFDFFNLATSIVGTLTEIASYAGLITIYVVFFVLEYSYFEDKLHTLCKTENRYKEVARMLSHINEQIQSYLKIKTLLSFLTGMLSYGVLSLIGVDSPGFWAFLIFVMNYIPTIGSIIATFFPCLLTLLQFGELAPFLTVTISLIIIQVFVGNYLEPRIMGKSFNLSGLFILFFLAVWGYIWGVLGMFLCVPIMMIITIVLANFKETRPVAVALSQDGNV